MPIKKYLLAGVIVWLPLAITVWLLLWLVGLFNGVFVTLTGVLLAVLPESLHHGVDSLRSIPGLGVILVLAVVLVSGATVTNVAGRWMVRQWDRLFTNIPIVKSIYTSVKKVSDTLFSSNGNAFRKAVLVQYPRAGSWTVAFLTGAPGGEVAAHLPGEHVSVYVPTTPNPTSGFFLMVPRRDIVELSMSVDEALTYIISMGAVDPSPPPNPVALEASVSSADATAPTP